MQMLRKFFGIGLIWFNWKSRAVQGISQFSLPLLVVIAWPGQASVCDSHKVETQTALLFFIFFTFSSFVQVGRFALPKLDSLGTGDCESSCIWCDQNVVNQLTNIFWLFCFQHEKSIYLQRAGKIIFFDIALKGHPKTRRAPIEYYGL